MKERQYFLNSLHGFYDDNVTITVHVVISGKGDERLNGGSITASYCSSRSAVTPVGSFRSSHLLSPAKTAVVNTAQIKYRGNLLSVLWVLIKHS